MFSIVDLHAITMPHDPKELTSNCRKMATALLASGVDANKCTLFVQSQVCGPCLHAIVRRHALGRFALTRS